MCDEPLHDRNIARAEGGTLDFGSKHVVFYECVGASAVNKMEDEPVWDRMTKPLPTGAMYCTELASPKVERRGIGADRWMDAVLPTQRLDKSQKQTVHITIMGIMDMPEKIDKR